MSWAGQHGQKIRVPKAAKTKAIGWAMPSHLHIGHAPALDAAGVAL